MELGLLVPQPKHPSDIPTTKLHTSATSFNPPIQKDDGGMIYLLCDHIRTTVRLVSLFELYIQNDFLNFLLYTVLSRYLNCFNVAPMLLDIAMWLGGHFRISQVSLIHSYDGFQRWCTLGTHQLKQSLSFFFLYDRATQFHHAYDNLFIWCLSLKGYEDL